MTMHKHKITNKLQLPNFKKFKRFGTFIFLFFETCPPCRSGGFICILLFDV
jgi:hypothetical protein